MNISSKLAKPRCYKRFMLDLQKINEEHLVNALNCINWDDIFVDIDDVDALYRVYQKKLNRFEIALSFGKQLLVSSFLCI
jgi:hypothetical protein